MTESEEFEMYEAKLQEAYFEAGADWVVCDMEELNKILENINLFKICKN
jgi:hypothetical protein